MKNLLKYQEEYFETDRMVQTKEELRALGYDDFDNLENSEDEQSSSGGGDEDTTHIGDDICLDDLTGNQLNSLCLVLVISKLKKKIDVI